MWEIIEKNKRNSFFVMIFIVSMIFAASYCVSPVLNAMFFKEISFNIYLGAAFALIFIIVTYFCTSWEMNLSGQSNYYEVDKTNYPQIYNIVEEMAIASGMDQVPRIYIMDTSVLNAYACGTAKYNYSVILTKGLIEILNRDELQGVIGHELAHIVNKDTLYLLCISSIVMVFSTISTLCLRPFGCSRRRRSIYSREANLWAIIIGLILLVFYFISKIAFLFLSRKREYLADACSASYTRYPQGLACALKKIEKFNNKSDYLDIGTNDFKNASYIVPLKGNADRDSIFSTHPSTLNRIRILLKMSGADYLSYNNAFRTITGRSGVIPKGALRSAKTEQKRRKSKDLISGAVLAGAMMQTSAPVEQKDKIEQRIKKHRQTEDMMWKLAGYTTILCECGTKLKIPPCYKGVEIVCPHCKKVHKG